MEIHEGLILFGMAFVVYGTVYLIAMRGHKRKEP